MRRNKMSLMLLLAWWLGLQGAGPVPADGRLIIHIDDAAVIPSSVRISGPRTTSRDRNGHADLTFDGLPPGQYDIEPVYDGGVGGPHRTLSIAAGKIATLTLTSDAVGAADIAAVTETCSAAFEFGVSQTGAAGGVLPVSARGGMPGGTRIVARFPKMRACGQRVGGLAPGTYQAFFNGPQGPISIVTFQVTAQQVVPVMVGPPPVRLTGHVLFNNKPPVQAFLRFLPRDAPSAPRVTADIGPDGTYMAVFPQTGNYGVVLVFGDTPLQGLTSATTLVVGANTFDWSATGGTLLVSFKGWDRQTPVVVTQQGGGMMQLSTYEPGAAYPIRIGPVPFGSYTVSGYQRDNTLAARESVTAVVDATHLEAAVEIELVRNPGTLSLRDDAGAPVRGAQITALMASRAAETSPGVYSFAGIPLGTSLRIVAAGFVPTCGFAAPEGAAITLSRGRPLEMIFERVVSATPPGSVVTSPGPPPCVVQLGQLKYTVEPVRAGERSRFTIQNFPPGDRFIWQMGSQQQEIVVPASGPVIVK